MNSFDGKTILITGATGFIGSKIISNLMQLKKINIIAISKNKKNINQYFSKYKKHKNFKSIAHDISKPLKNIKYNIDYIFHAASPQESKVINSRPVDVIFPNLLGTINCLNFIKKKQKNKKKIRLIFFSSVTIYANKINKNVIFDESNTSITENIMSINAPYSQSKRMAEIIINSYIKQYKIDAIICRLSTVYGPTKYKVNNAFFKFINDAVLNKDIIVKSSALPKRDNIYIDDAISGLFLAALRGKNGEAYNISSNGDLGNFLAVDEIAKKVVDIYNNYFLIQSKKKLKFIIYRNSLKKRKGGIRLDNSKIKKLGWSLKTSICEGIKKSIKKKLDRMIEVKKLSLKI